MNIGSLISALPGAIAQGLIWGVMAIGVYLTYKVLDIADLTVDGTMATGGAVCVMMLLNGANLWLAMLCAVLAGMIAGLVTGIFHTAMGIPAILAGIRASKNIPTLKDAYVNTINVYDLLNADKIIVLKGAMQDIQEVYA